MSNVQPSVTALIPAAGSSSRMGSAGSKALLEIAGRTALQRVVGEIHASGLVQRCVILAPPDSIETFRNLDFGSVPVAFQVGGATRQDSVRCGLEYLERGARETRPDFVLVHDAARCLVSKELVEKSIRAAFVHHAVTAALPVVDSMVRVEESSLRATAIDRKNLWAVQTPQVFTYELLMQAHMQKRSGATDDASLVEHIHPIHVIQGERANIKLTTPEDVLFARAMIGKV